MSDIPNLSGKVGLDITDFKTGISEINRNIRVVESGFRSSAAALGDWGKSAQGLETRIKALNSEIDLQNKKVEALSNEYERVAKEKGDTSRAAQELQIKLNKETETLGNMQNELGQTEGALKNLNTTTVKSKGAFQELGTQFDNLKQQVPALGTAFNLLSNPITLAVVGLGAFTKLTKDSIADTIEYNKQVRDMATATGLSADETSRIIQVADDWQISISDAQSALEMMNKKGVTPSIDKLAAIADEFVNSKDKAAFAEEATKKYGRSFENLIPMLSKGGDALRAATASVDDNLIATDKSIKASRDYEVAMDNLKDSSQELKYTLGNELIPVLVKVATALSGAINIDTRFNDAMKEAIATGDKAYKNDINRARSITDETTAIVALNNAYTIHLVKMGLITDKGERDVIPTLEGVQTAAQSLSSQGINPLTGDMKDLHTAAENATANVAGDMAIANQAAKDFAKQGIATLNGAINNLTDQAISKYTNSLTVTMKLQAAFQLATGQITQAQYDQTTAVADSLKPLEEYTKLVEDGSIDMSRLTQAMADGKVTREELITAFISIGMNAKDAADKVDGLLGTINNIPHVYPIEFPVTVTGQPLPSGTHYNPHTGNYEYQYGADFIVPSGYPNDSFPMNVESGERVIVIPRGEMLGNHLSIIQQLLSQSIMGLNNPTNTINPKINTNNKPINGPINITIQGVPEKPMDAYRLARNVATEIQRRQK